MGFVPVDLLSSSTRFVVVKIVIPVAAIVVTVIVAVVFVSPGAVAFVATVVLVTYCNCGC